MKFLSLLFVLFFLSVPASHAGHPKYKELAEKAFQDSGDAMERYFREAVDGDMTAILVLLEFLPDANSKIRFLSDLVDTMSEKPNSNAAATLGTLLLNNKSPDALRYLRLAKEHNSSDPDLDYNYAVALANFSDLHPEGPQKALLKSLNLLQAAEKRTPSDESDFILGAYVVLFESAKAKCAYDTIDQYALSLTELDTTFSLGINAFMHVFKNTGHLERISKEYGRSFIESPEIIKKLIVIDLERS